MQKRARLVGGRDRKLFRKPQPSRGPFLSPFLASPRSSSVFTPSLLSEPSVRSPFTSPLSFLYFHFVSINRARLLFFFFSLYASYSISLFIYQSIYRSINLFIKVYQPVCSFLSPYLLVLPPFIYRARILRIRRYP